MHPPMARLEARELQHAVDEPAHPPSVARREQHPLALTRSERLLAVVERVLDRSEDQRAEFGTRGSRSRRTRSWRDPALPAPRCRRSCSSARAVAKSDVTCEASRSTNDRWSASTARFGHAEQQHGAARDGAEPYEHRRRDRITPRPAGQPQIRRHRDDHRSARVEAQVMVPHERIGADEVDAHVRDRVHPSVTVGAKQCCERHVEGCCGDRFHDRRGRGRFVAPIDRGLDTSRSSRIRRSSRTCSVTSLQTACMPATRPSSSARAECETSKYASSR